MESNDAQRGRNGLPLALSIAGMSPHQQAAVHGSERLNPCT
jgi:hypothetical protein